MRLYHYTSVAMADGILLTDLSNGHMTTPEGIISPVVWLTTDPKGEGHGLTDGTETLTNKKMFQLALVDGQMPKNRKTADKMKVRLAFDIPSNEMLQLQRFSEYCDQMPYGKTFAKWTGVSCYVDMDTADPNQVRSMMESHPTKEETWWISFIPVSARFITAVDIRGADGNYYPYDFEKLVRPALEEIGFSFPSIKAVTELAAIVKPLHPLGYTKPLIFCPEPDATPTIAIRDGGTFLCYEIETGKNLINNVDHELQISAWIASYRAELMDAWEQAKKTYYSYYPSH